MDRTWWVPAFLALFCAFPGSAFPGRRFLAVFPQNDDGATSPDLRLFFLLLPQAPPTQVTVTFSPTARGGPLTRTLLLGRKDLGDGDHHDGDHHDGDYHDGDHAQNTFTLRLPPTLELVGNRLSEKVVLIRATQDISVVAHSSKSYTSGATAILPLEMLGHQYYVVTPEDHKKEGLKELAVVAGEAATTVTIKAKGKIYYRGKNYSPGATIKVNLEAYHTLQLQSSSDLSGSEVKADKPVAVFSGHTCVKIHTGCDHVVEQLLPVTSWDRTYLVPPNPWQKTTDIVYMVAAGKTTVTYQKEEEEVATKSLNAGEVQKVKVGPNSPLYITSSAPIQVVFFFTGATDSLKRDPFLLNVPPVSTYCTSYQVVGLPGYINHLLLVARQEEATSTTFNQKLEKTFSWQDIPGTDFSWASFTMSDPDEVQTVDNQRSPFGLLNFGFDNYIGYGFTGLCATTSPSLSCEDLSCQEKCQVVDGQPTCVHEAPLTCWATGDSHYQTFDGKAFHLTGTCTYTLTKTCHQDPTIPFFRVEAKNEARGHLGVSYLDAVTVHVYDITVEATRAENGIVRVNNRRSHLPVSLARGKLRLRQKGRSLLIQTHFHLKVLYDWDHHLVVKLPAALAAKVCGLCGNGPPRLGQLSQSHLMEDLAWEATDQSQPCWDNCSGGECGGCPGDQGKKYEGEESCGLMAQRPGPFEGCHNTLDPQVYLKNCVYDLCVNDGLHVLLCRALEAYADDCQEEGAAVSDWRTLVNCPLSCPVNSNYTTCGPACPTTCNPTAVPTDCPTSACVETCSCQEGFLLEANRCVPQEQCGCLHEGLLHGLHEEFWGDTTCTKRCVCDGTSQNAVCREDNCREGEECRVEEGIQGCYPKNHGTCSAVGATHYRTFDGGRFIFQGTCLYQMVGLCEKTPGLVDFQVLVQNGRPDEEPPASIALVVVKVYGKTIGINRKQPGKITVNGRLANLPYGRRGGKVSVSRGPGGDAVLETDFGLAVSYDGRSRLVATVPSTLAGALCGLCGDYNGRKEDDMMTKGGQVTSDPTVLGASWKVTTVPGCGETPISECPAATMEALRRQEASGKGCGLIREEGGPFGACHALVDPQKYFQSCLRDLCLFPEREGVRCPLIARYAEVCQAAGVAVGRWRTEDFCRFPCPPNSHYEPCARGCGRSCRSLFSPEKCQERCREGCACNEGLVLSGDTCVPLSRCGCHQGDFYYQAEETFMATKEEMCRCRAGGTLECQKASCPGGGEGEIVEGVFQCSSATLGTCLATGDRSYVSFDGVAFNFSGACSYVLSETCGGGEEGGQPFAVKIEKEARQKKKVSSIQEVSLEVYGLTLSLTRGRRGYVMVDSISHRLPVTLRQGRVWVQQHGMDVLLQTDFGLVLRYDLLRHVTVTVPQSYQGHLCGLCGNYNGQQDDDFLLPGGQVAPNVVAFGSSWKTSEAPCSDDCSQDDCPTCSKEKKAVLQKSNYCGLLTVPEGPFGSCHHLIDPTLYFQTCLHDLCLAEGDTQVLCQSIQSYAIACQEAGGIIGAWRRRSFCPLRCPANSTYSLCTNLCPKSCAGLVDPSKCPQTCLEGCECHQGLVFDGLGCVPQEECGCFEGGEYHQPRQWFLKDNCQERCACFPGEGLTCSNHSCTEDETCEIREGVLDCVNQNPCKALRCRPKEKCKLEEGQATCVPSLVATCWAWGDPHYHTFDGLDFDFQGTCTYTMAESHGNDTSLVPFKVEGKNDVRGGVKSVSYVSLAKVKVYGQEITIRRREVGKVRVNGVVMLLPVTLEEGKVRVTQSGLSAVVETDFGLRVTYDWNWHLLLDLPSSYYRHVHGLCGNFNLKPEDDGPQGDHDPPALVAWAQGWKVPEEDDPFCWDYCDGDCPFCEEEEKELYGGNQFCGLIKKGYQGPFQGCHHLVPPRDFYRNCLYDVCMSKGAKQILCKVLESYAATCRKQGAVVHDWRTPSGCPLPCPPNSHYEPCGTACPPTCLDPQPPASCPHPCVETCACDPGHLLSGGHCVPAADCGCRHEGAYHPPGEDFWADETCHTRCRCDPALGMVVCRESACKAGEKCALVRGVRRCVATGRAVCVATGDPHYTTFDGRRYDFMGTCIYQLAALCSAADPQLVPFAVTVENDHRGNKAVSYTKEVTLKVYNMTLSLSKEHPQKLKADGILVDLPFHHGEQLQAFAKGVHGFLKTDFDLTVTFDWYSYARVILPTTYAGAVCGLCGDADGDPRNDLAFPNGTLANEADGDDGGHHDHELQFARSWKVEDIPGCQEDPCPDGGSCGVCTEAQKRGYRGDKHCGLLVKKKGPLAACHDVIDPAPFFEDCLFDVCLYQGHQETVCASLAAYVTACQSRGVPVKPWRTPAFCSPVCPPNQHYELCGPPCPATCQGQTLAQACEEEEGGDPRPPPAGAWKAVTATGGSFPAGGAAWPPPSAAAPTGGVITGGGEEFVPDPLCSQRCLCRAGGAVECQAWGCPPGEECGVRGGVRGCYPPPECGRCQVLGGGSYSTFDGASLRLGGSRGGCTYTLLAVDPRSSSSPPPGEEPPPEEPPPALVDFGVQLETESEGGATVIRRLLVTVRGVTVGLARGEQWEVTVNGERHLLPLHLELAGGGEDGGVPPILGVTQEGTHRVLRVPGGPQLLYDGGGYLLLTLPAPYRRLPTGLCGDFDGDPTDDTPPPQKLGGPPTFSCTPFSPPAPCPTAPAGPCGVLVEEGGPFQGCHGVVPPQEYLWGCLQETGGCEGGEKFGGAPPAPQEALCRSLQAYAAACQAAGGTLRDWRGGTNCPLRCPPNSHYELCTRSCAHGCAVLLGGGPPCPPKCFEGCECDGGFLFDGGGCVPPSACGCLHRGRYFQIAETVLSPDCRQSCTCRSPGGMSCHPAACPFGQTCGHQDGVRACVDQPGRCTLAPASRLVSFDGATTEATTAPTVATGIYMAVALCDHRRPDWFRLLLDVGEIRDRPTVVALHLFVPKVFLTLKRDKKVWVNGVPATLPVVISTTLTVNETRGTLWVTQDPQFVIGLSPGGEVTVTVTQDLGHHLCGLCGDYDGVATNDLRGPDGTLVGDAVALAKAWRAPDFVH